LEEADVVVDLFERDLGIDVRRIFEVRTRILERLRNLRSRSIAARRRTFADA
jgi:hypothetical protein